MHPPRPKHSLFLAFLLLLPLPALARDGDVSGTVTDQTGAALPGVTVEAASPALADGPRSARTDAEGRFAIGDLPAGDYSVSFSLSGFDTLNRDGVSISGADGATLDIRLQIESLIQEVTVVGSKLGTGRQEFGVSVAHLGADRIDSDAIVNVEDAFHRAANVYVGTAEMGAFAIRGVNNNGLESSFSNGTSLASILVNQLALGPRTSDHLNPSLFDAESVEILRGPQSTLQGPNSLIGSVLINYNRAAFDGYDGRVRVEGGGLDTERIQFMQNLELVDEILSARVVHEDRYIRGAVSNIVNDTDDRYRTDVETTRVLLALRPRADDSLRFDLTWLRSDSDSIPWGYHMEDPSRGIEMEDRIQVWNREDAYPSDVNLLNLEAHIDVGERWAIDAVVGASEFDGAQLFDADFTPFDILNVDAWSTDDVTSQELRASYRGPVVNLLLGAFHSESEFGYGFGGVGFFPDATGNIVPFNRTTRLIEDVEQTDVFGRIEWDATDRLHFTGGVRLSRDSRHNLNFADNNGFVSELDAQKDFDQVLPSASVTFDVASNTSLGASYARGFKAGGFAFGVFLGVAEPYDEEFTDNVEFFLRHRTADGRMILNANVYRIDWTDQQIPYTPPFGFPGFDSLVANAGKSRLQGLEVETEVFVSNALSLFASFGVADSEFVQFVLDGVDYAGRALPQAPEWNGSVGLNWRSPAGWFAGGTLSYADEAYSELAAPEVTRLRTRTLLDGRFGYRRGGWALYAWGKNLLDHQYEVSLFNGAPFGLPGAYGIYGPPRSAGVGIDFNW